MRHHSRNMLLITLVGGMLLTAGCSGLVPEPTPAVNTGPVEEFVPIVTATGAVVPEQWATLSLPTSGIVAELLVVEGDSVDAGQVRDGRK